MTRPTNHELRRAIANAGRFANPAVAFDVDERVDAPLDTQVAALIAWATSHKPEPFRRSVPVTWSDHDELITNALGKLLALLAETAPPEGRLVITLELPQPVDKVVAVTELVGRLWPSAMLSGNVVAIGADS